MTEAALIPVIERLEAARRELLDLGLRNPMLNHRPTRARGLIVVDAAPDVVFRRLVGEGKAVSCQAAEGEPKEGWLGGDRRPEGKLQTGLAVDPLQKILLETAHAARGFIEERGANALFLALGMLEWLEPDAPRDVRRAPLILVPVELTRASAQSRFELRFTGESLLENLSLATKLRQEFGIDLPPLPEIEDLVPAAYMAACAAALPAALHWRVDREAVALDFFAYGKFFMYKDLDPSAWPAHRRPEDHMGMRALLAEGFREPPAPWGEDDDLDADPAIVDPLVLDADGTQVLVLRHVAAGRNLVVQGPPGTGKSQTIANMLAAAIGSGKKVLFVAEKMAALEVVKRRLDAVGLGDACLELHSHKARKKSLLEELRRTRELGRPRLAATADDDAELLVELRGRLNAYAGALHAPIGDSGMTPYAAIAEMATAGTLSVLEAGILPAPEAWSGATARRRFELVEQLVAQRAALGPPEANPYAGAGLAELTRADRQVIAALTAEAQAATQVALAAAPALGQPFGWEAPPDRDAALRCVRAVERLSSRPAIEGLPVADRRWVARQARLREALAAGTRLAALRAQQGAAVVPAAWERDWTVERAAIAAHGQSWFRILNGDYRRAMARLRGLCQGLPPVTYGGRLALLDALDEGRRLAAKLAEERELAGDLFGDQWAGGDWPVLARTFDWIRGMHEDVGAGLLPAAFPAWLEAHPTATPVDLSGPADDLARFDAAWARVVAALAYAPPIAALPFTGLADRLATWLADPEALEAMAAHNRLALALDAEGLAALARPAIAALPDLVASARQAWHAALWTRACRERGVLAQFDGVRHDMDVARFVDLDRAAQVHQRARLAMAHWDGMPARDGGGEWAVLRREFEKRSRLLEIRQLMGRAGNAIQAIKPVFMMSPQSIATFLPQEGPHFDLVIFDEASQVRPVDAFGGILRAKQVVVVGDKRQMPPTSFFDSPAGGSAVDDDGPADFESVLGLFEAQGAPQHMLRWHYRSRHASLIAVANREFYDGRLVVFPGPEADRRRLGLRLHALPDAVYDRGGKRTNPREARAVAEAVMAHARQHPAWTLGVAAFSVAQQDAIREEIEALRRTDAGCEAFFAAHPHEPFFVKNLETVQGDERDVIYVSIGYGRDGVGGLSMNFGPLNRDGGERRLNVLITRARLRCEVFTALKADDLKLGEDAPRGLRALAAFLRDAAGGAEAATAGVQATGLARAWHERLATGDGTVAAGLGAVGSGVDVALAAPDDAGRYLLGLVGDGPGYVVPRSARDRDRLVPQVLAGLGWRLHRLWAPDWLRRPEAELRRVALEMAAAIAAVDAADLAPPELPAQDEPLAREAAAQPVAGPPIPPYTLAAPAIALGDAELYAVSVNVLATWLVEVVQVEGPVHVEEAQRRVAHAAGVRRIGTRIQAALTLAQGHAERGGQIERRGEFLWQGGRTSATPRDRSALPATARKLVWVAPEEVEAAVARVVADAVGLDREEAVNAAARLLGFARAGDDGRVVMLAVIDVMVAARRLIQRGDRLSSGPGS